MKALMVMQSDFGIDSGLVASMHGMCKLVDRELEVEDITHEIPAFDIKAASYCLQYTVPYWPEGTVFVSVVDPGVGTNRKASVAKLSNGSYVVTPDNGTLTYLQDMVGIVEIRVIDEERNRYENTKDVHTFHGRDLFAYCGARLAAGIITYEEVGEAYPVQDIIRHEVRGSQVSDKYVKAYIQSYDPFGSAELSVQNKDFAKAGFKYGDRTKITITCEGEVIFSERVSYEKSFGYVPIGENLIFNDLASFVTIACNQGYFARKYNLDEGKDYLVEITG